jgi:hypothetical protein
VTRSYVDSLLSSSFVIWIDEQQKEEKKNEQDNKHCVTHMHENEKDIR